VARFWAITGRRAGTHRPLARAVAQADLIDNARLFALVNMAASDAFVAVFDAKYAFEFGARSWRYATAEPMRRGFRWSIRLCTPEYPCAHCISAAALAVVLESQFGRGTIPMVTLTSPTAPGVTRSWTRIEDYVQEVKNARIWGGIHYRNSALVGKETGRKIGQLAVQAF